MGFDRDRVMEVFVQPVNGPGRVGSGYRVTERSVLTAGHVVTGLPVRSPGEAAAGDEGTGRCELRALGDRAWTSGSVLWCDNSADVAVIGLAGDVPPLPPGSPVPRWGRVDGMEPVAVTAVGFPWAQERPDRGRDSEQLFGFIAPATTVKAGLCAVTVQTAAPAGRTGGSPWAGMSGAALFAGPFLVGVVAVDPARFGADRVAAAPVAPLLADSELAGLLDVSAEGVATVGPRLRLITITEEAVEATPQGHPNRGGALTNLGAALSARYRQTGRQEDLDRAITITKEAVDGMPRDDPARALGLSNLGDDLRDRFGRTGRLEDLDRAITVTGEAVKVIPQGHPGRGVALMNLGAALSARYGQTGRPEDLDRTITVTGEAVKVIPQGHPNRGVALANLGAAFLRRFDLSGTLEDLDEAIDVGQAGVDAAPKGHPNRPLTLSSLGGALDERYRQTGSPEDLDRAITVMEEALEGTPRDHPNWVAYQSNLGAALSRRFDRGGNPEDLDRALALTEETVDATPRGQPYRALALTQLGSLRRRRFERTGMQDDLDQAIAAGEEAVETTAEDHPDRATRLFNLGGTLERRFERSGRLEDLDRAISLIEKAVDMAPSGLPDRAMYLSSLGMMLERRFEYTGTLEDLNRAIALGEEAVHATPEGYADRVARLSNLGCSLKSRFERTAMLGDLNRAIVLLDEAVGAAPDSYASQGTFLSNLGNALLLRFEHTGKQEDLDRAVAVAQEAVNVTHSSLPDRAMFLSNLATILRCRFEHTGKVEDLDLAVAASKEAVNGTPQGNPNRGTRLFTLGTVLTDRFRFTWTAGDAKRALVPFREAAGVVSAPVDVRADAARQWGRLAVQVEDWAEAVEGFTTAVELAGLVAPRGLGRADQESRLSKLAGLGAEAAAACVQAGQLGRAAELFEQGRAVLFSHVLDARTDLTDLQETHPELAAEFARWRDALDRPDMRLPGMSANDVDPGMAADAAAAWRRDTAAEFERVLSEIQALPGFGRFLAPRPVEELLSAAVGGPVVLINIAPQRSDALILTVDGVEVLPLPGAYTEEVAHRADRFLEALTEIYDPAGWAPARTAAEAQLGGVLGWLWEEVTGPVLDHLGYTTNPAEGTDWPRVWWCPSGPLALLPLHAAGHHNLSGNRPDAVIDRVISSTIPNVRALLHARQAPPPSRDTRVLVVAMPYTPGQADLPGAAQEADTLSHLLPGRVDVLGLAGSPPATYDSVTAALRDHTWVHFACHSQTNLTDPSASHLLLADQKTTRPLTVVDLTQARLQGAELAFLGACTTARTGVALPDEPIHLSAACQLAGYRHVIATLWPISDNDSAWFAKRFYTKLSTTPTAAAATVLHNTTRQLRSIYRTRPSHWASYIHAGP